MVYYVADSLNNVNDNIATGIQDINDNEMEITIYPNPAKDIIYLDFAAQNQSHEKFSFILYSIVGQKILEGELENNTIPIYKTSKGIYFLELHYTQKRVIRKIIIE